MGGEKYTTGELYASTSRVMMFLWIVHLLGTKLLKKLYVDWLNAIHLM